MWKNAAHAGAAALLPVAGRLLARLAVEKGKCSLRRILPSDASSRPAHANVVVVWAS